MSGTCSTTWPKRKRRWSIFTVPWIRFRLRLTRLEAQLESVRADCAATLVALDSGDVSEMERVRDAILARKQARDRCVAPVQARENSSHRLRSIPSFLEQGNRQLTHEHPYRL